MMSEFRELLASRGRVAIAATFHDRSANASTANIDIEAREAAERPVVAKPQKLNKLLH
jgi:hypothetical protein